MYEFIKSTVIHGKQRWRTIWFPTINCFVDKDTIQLTAGTYRVNVIIEWITYPWIGPWFLEQSLFEVHLLDTDGDFYDKEVIIIPLAKIRENQQFSSIEMLQEQIQKDLLRAKNNPQHVITFGTFDYFHPGHQTYLQSAKQYGDMLITIVARDETVFRIKWAYPDHNEQKRMKRLEEETYITIVELWDRVNPWSCLSKWKPNVIYLWYDQHSFDTWVRERCDKNNLHETVILRWNSVHPEKRKSSLLKNKAM